MKTLASLAIFSLLLSGCIIKQYGGAGGGESLARHNSLALDLAAAFGERNYDKMAGKKVALILTSLGMRGKNEAAVEDYLRAFIEEKVARLGGTLVSDDGNPDVFILVRLRASGVQTTERDLKILNYPVMYSLTVSGFAGIDLAGYDVKEKKFFLLEGVDRVTDRDELYLFKIFGPILIKR